MKTKAQKQEELNSAKELLEKSKVLLFTEVNGVSAENVRGLRKKVGEVGAKILVAKKRLLAIAMKDKGMEFDPKKFNSSVGTVFSPSNAEDVSGAVYKFFSNLGEDKETKEQNLKKILGGYDLQTKSFIESKEIVMMGQLPPREVILSMLLSMLIAPVRSFMYVLDQKSKQVEN